MILRDVWEIGRVHNLRHQLKRRRNNSLGSYDGSKHRDNKRRPEHARRNGQEKRISVCGRYVGDVGGLANVCEEETRICQAEPRHLNGARLESAQMLFSK